MSEGLQHHYQPQRRKPRNGVQCCTFTGTTDTRGQIQQFKEKPINLEALFAGGNPFDETELVTHNGDAEVNPDDVPF